MRKTCLVMLLIISFFSFSTAYHAAFALQNKRWCEVDFEQLIIWINGKIKLITPLRCLFSTALENLYARIYFIAICIVIENAILVVQRRIDRSSHRRFSIKKVFLQISQNSQENTCARISPLRDSFTGFLRIFWNLKDHFFYKTPLGDCFCI